MREGEGGGDLYSTGALFNILTFMGGAYSAGALIRQRALSHLRYAQVIINFRMAMRLNNSRLAYSAIYKISPLFYGRNHPFYQQIEFYYMVQMFLQPSQVKSLIDRNFTISLSNDRSRGEDWDFILEGKNKIIKSWIPKGASRDKYWTTACRNTELLEIRRAKQNDFVGIKQSANNPHEPDLEDKINIWRATLRRFG